VVEVRGCDPLGDAVVDGGPPGVVVHERDCRDDTRVQHVRGDDVTDGHQRGTHVVEQRSRLCVQRSRRFL
jgi:hypothetical protein